MKWSEKNPESPGKYVVETVTSMGRKQKLEAFWNGKSWDVTNQTVVRFINESIKDDVRIVVQVKGGMIQRIDSSSDNVIIAIVDYDIESEDPENSSPHVGRYEADGIFNDVSDLDFDPVTEFHLKSYKF